MLKTIALATFLMSSNSVQLNDELVGSTFQCGANTYTFFTKQKYKHNFKIGDTLTEGEKLQFKGIPSFSPETFRELVNLDPMKTKQLDKGIVQLTDEGVAQLFVRSMGHKKVIGTVGELQFEVIRHRLEHEYGAKCEFRGLCRAGCVSHAYCTSGDRGNNPGCLHRLKAEGAIGE